MTLLAQNHYSFSQKHPTRTYTSSCTTPSSYKKNSPQTTTQTLVRKPQLISTSLKMNTSTTKSIKRVKQQRQKLHKTNHNIHYHEEQTTPLGSRSRHLPTQSQSQFLNPKNTTTTIKTTKLIPKTSKSITSSNIATPSSAPLKHSSSPSIHTLSPSTDHTTSSHYIRDIDSIISGQIDQHSGHKKQLSKLHICSTIEAFDLLHRISSGNHNFQERPQFLTSSLQQYMLVNPNEPEAQSKLIDAFFSTLQRVPHTQHIHEIVDSFEGLGEFFKHVEISFVPSNDEAYSETNSLLNSTQTQHSPPNNTQSRSLVPSKTISTSNIASPFRNKKKTNPKSFLSQIPDLLAHVPIQKTFSHAFNAKNHSQNIHNTNQSHNKDQLGQLGQLEQIALHPFDKPFQQPYSSQITNKRRK